MGMTRPVTQIIVHTLLFTSTLVAAACFKCPPFSLSGDKFHERIQDVFRTIENEVTQKKKNTWEGGAGLTMRHESSSDLLL